MKAAVASVKQRPRSSTASEFLAALIRTAYLPLELPPAITTRLFAEFCNAEYKTLEGHSSKLIKQSTIYETFNAPRPRGGRRTLALVHPLAQLGISLVLTKHRARIKQIITERGTSLYRADEDRENQKAFSGLQFDRWNIERSRLYSECPVVLTADISRFFYTAYTHSIPWAIIGKEKAKSYFLHDKKKLYGHWSSDLDTALQACQSRETFGIPVGPDTSRIVAELLLSGVEKDGAFAAATQGRPMVRLLDDFVIGFEDEQTAQRALAALRSALWKYNLQLNDEKTSITSARNLYSENWKLEYSALGISDTDPTKQARDISRLVDRTLEFCALSKTGAPASWACNRLLSIKNTSHNFPTILDAVLRLARDFPSCIHIATAFLVNHQAQCQHSAVKGRVTAWLASTMRLNTQHGNDYELAWCLLISGVLRVPLDERTLPDRDVIPSGVVLALLGMLRERKMIEVPLSRWNWRGEFKKTGIMGSTWLPYYEAVLRKWTNDKSIINAVMQDPILAAMFKAKVSFLEDRIFDASRIDISARTFRKALRRSPTVAAAKERPHRLPLPRAENRWQDASGESLDFSKFSAGNYD